MSEEIPEDYYLKYPEQTTMKNSFKKGEREAEQFNQRQWALMYPGVKAENSELRAALKELIIICEEVECSQYSRYKSAIERAKRLTQ